MDGLLSTGPTPLYFSALLFIYLIHKLKYFFVKVLQVLINMAAVTRYLAGLYVHRLPLNGWNTP